GAAGRRGIGPRAGVPRAGRPTAGHGGRRTPPRAPGSAPAVPPLRHPPQKRPELPRRLRLDGHQPAPPRPPPRPPGEPPRRRPPTPAAPASANSLQGAGMRIKDRYEVTGLLSERSGINRLAGLDHAASPPRPVIIVQAAMPELPEVVVPFEEPTAMLDEEILPTFEDPLPMAQIEGATGTSWPSTTWEQALLAKLNHPGLPQVLESFIDGNASYLIEEVPQGESLWNAWDDPAADANTRYGWLQQIAEALRALHDAGAVCESL